MQNTCSVPFHVPSIGEEEIREVVAALRSGWLTTGPRTHQFEKDFATYVGAPHAVALSSATAGLHLALAALKIGPGDEVITTPLTFCATVNTILQVGATPVLADVRPDGNIDPKEVERRVTARTKAIVPVHLAGLPCEMDMLWALARRHNLHVIEDAAHAAGASYRGTRIGDMNQDPHKRSDAVVFSFYANKNMTTGEGGMVTVADPVLADAIQTLSLHGISKSAWNRYDAKGHWYYEVQACGYKYNLTDIQSALGIHQLRKLDQMIDTRAFYAHMYQDAFADMDELETPAEHSWCRHAWHLYILRLNLDLLDIGRDEFIDALRERGVIASVHFIPVPLHPYYASLDCLKEPVPRALEFYRSCVSLPLYPLMTADQVRYVSSTVRQIIAARRRFKTIPLSVPTISDVRHPAVRL